MVRGNNKRTGVRDNGSPQVKLRLNPTKFSIGSGGWGPSICSAVGNPEGFRITAACPNIALMGEGQRPVLPLGCPQSLAGFEANTNERCQLR